MPCEPLLVATEKACNKSKKGNKDDKEEEGEEKKGNKVGEEKEKEE